MDPLRHAQRFLPKTDAEFQDYLSGRKQPRPKILVHPETRHYYRLVEQKNVPVKDWRYEEIKIDPVNVDFYSIGAEKLQEALKNEPAMPEGCHIKSYRLHQKDLRPNEQLIKPIQLYTLLNAIGIDSSWWPLEDPNYNVEHIFGEARINVLFRDKKPLGAILWDDSDIKKDGSSTWLMVGLRPEERSHGYGSFLIKWQMAELSRQGATSLNLYTGDTDFIVSKDGTQIPASSYYEKLGAVKKGTDYADHRAMVGNSHHSIIIDHSMLDMPEEYFADPATSARQPRFEEQELGRRLDAAFRENVISIPPKR